MSEWQWLTKSLSIDDLIHCNLLHRILGSIIPFNSSLIITFNFIHIWICWILFWFGNIFSLERSTKYSCKLNFILTEWALHLKSNSFRKVDIPFPAASGSLPIVYVPILATYGLCQLSAKSQRLNTINDYRFKIERYDAWLITRVQKSSSCST